MERKGIPVKGGGVFFMENRGFHRKIRVSGDLWLKIGKSRELKRPVLNVDKILNFGVGVGFFKIYTI